LRFPVDYYFYAVNKKLATIGKMQDVPASFTKVI